MQSPQIESHFVTLELTGVEPVRVHYLESGTGPALLLLHGTALDSAQLTYAHLIPELATTYRVIALDWPGYGESDKPKLNYTMAFYESVLASFVARLELNTFSVAAFSMGGGITLGYALTQPGRIENLILIDSYALGGGVHVPFLPFLILKIPGAASLVWSSLRRSDAFLSFCLRHFVCGQGQSVTQQMMSDVKAQLELPGLYNAFTDWLSRELGAIQLATNHKRSLREVSNRTLLIHGGRDLIVPAYRAERAAKLMPNVRTHIIPKAGHWTPREAPHEVLKVMKAFLEKEA